MYCFPPQAWGGEGLRERPKYQCGNFEVPTDPQEFYDTRWMTIEEAKSRVINPANLKALDVVEKNNA